MSYTIQIRRTLDGSDTLFVPELNEHFHSTFGAVQESQHVFIRHGLQAIDRNDETVGIFEVGFGTGLNALLTSLAAKKRPGNIRYASVELYPLNKAILDHLNYVSFLKEPEAGEEFGKIHGIPWGTPAQIHPSFELTKLRGDLRGTEFPDETVDIIYFDAFAPCVQPELWTVPVFQKLFRILRPGGMLVTYSCKGQVKRNLREAGFSIEKLPGPPGKREMLRAWKQ